MALSYVEQVYDNIHGYIPLTKVEAAIVRSPIFQRLRHVKQLGLVNMVFPGAEHSRFAHCLGVLHIVTRLTEALSPRLEDDQQQLLRIGALLHDVGHFPLSHAMEEAMADLEETKRNEEAKQWASGWARDLMGVVTTPPPKRGTNDKLHEFLGQTIIQSTEIGTILEDNGISPLDVAAIAMGKTGELPPEEATELSVLPVMSQMLHSQVDADRIDYLLRDSNFSGVEAGGFDLPKLYKEARWDKGRFGFTQSGLRAVEQFLMTRLTNYRRIVFNKHVQAFEQMAKVVYRDLAAVHSVPDFEGVRLMLDREPNGWVRFNDHFFMHKIAECTMLNGPTELAVRHASGILNGRPMVEVQVEERFCTKAEWAAFKAQSSKIPKSHEELAELAERAHVRVDELTILEAGVKVVEDLGQEPISIFNDSGAYLGEILEMPESLLSSLLGKRLYVRRLYCLDEQVAERVRPVLLN
ncbi:MAG TPA: HD domain-containing protein [Symbiobacteriaceae bacterium]|nr:HD domain-containing protein [Symbiobacteriaceae bacterium]